MLKIITVVGARPQFVKAAALSKALKIHECVEEILIHTGQHYHENLSDIFFAELDLPQPKYNLQVGSSSHASQTGQMLNAIEKILIDEKPHCILLYGDTNSTLAGAIAAVKLHIPIIHVEAGLRSNNHLQAEEVNRILTDRIADLLFAPTERSAKNLINEAVSPTKIHISGDIMYDVIKNFESSASKKPILQTLGLTNDNYLVATVHRAENTDNCERLTAIITALNEVSNDFQIVLPIHPRTRKYIDAYALKINSAIKLIEPLGFLDMMQLVRNSALVITDSGGLQKEAFYHKVGCIILRDETEWTELIDSGWNRLLSPTQLYRLGDLIQQIRANNRKWENPYGDGTTAQQIAATIVDKYYFASRLE